MVEVEVEHELSKFVRFKTVRRLLYMNASKYGAKQIDRLQFSC